MYQNRDMGLNHIRARRDHRCYGMGLGIIILDESTRAFPATCATPAPIPFPIQYEIAEGVDIVALVTRRTSRPAWRPSSVRPKSWKRWVVGPSLPSAATFAYFQKEIARHVDVPVFMSSLLQVSWAQQLIGSNRLVGLFASSQKDMTAGHLAAVGIQPDTNYVLGGIEEYGRCPQFDNLWLESTRPDPPEAYYDRAEQEFVAVATASSSMTIPTWGPWF